MAQADIAEVGAGCPPSHDMLRFTGVCKAFGGTQALQDVGFGIGKGQVHALLGGNGSGKSTLIKILAGVYQANDGVIEVGGESVDARQTTPGWAHAAGLRFVHQAMGTFADFSVAENFALGSSYGSAALSRVNWRALNARVGRTLDRFELAVSPSTRMGDLRQAQQTLVAIARALEDERNSAILVLDEPTAALPAHEVAQVHEAIRGYVRHGHTVVIVSHRVDEVLAVATHATFLRDGRHLATRTVAELDERTIVQQIAGMDAAGQLTRRTAVEKRPFLQVSNLAVGVVEDVSFTVHQGEILGLSGLAGSGRSSLLRCIAGLRTRRSGDITLDGEALRPSMRPDQAIGKGIAYIPEDRTNDAAFLEKSIRENLTAPALKRFWSMGRIGRAAERTATRHAIDRYKVVAPSSETVFSALSGGNQQKIILARWLELKPRLLLLDEPTQGVDVGARIVLHNLVREAADAGMAIIVSSSDARELSDLSDRVIGISEGRVSGELVGDALGPHACVELAYGRESEQSHANGKVAVNGGSNGRQGG